MTTAERLVAIVDAAKPTDEPREILYAHAIRGTAARHYADALRTERAEWLAVRRLAEAVPEMISILEEVEVRASNLLTPTLAELIFDLNTKLRNPSPEPPA